MRKLLLACGLLLAALGGLAAWLASPLVSGAGADEADRTVLGDLISRALSTPASRVTVGAVDGALSSDATIRNIVLADKDGPWLKLDRARLVWRRLALLQKRLEIDNLEIGRLEILRRPAPAPASEAPPASGEPLLPELPVKVIVRKFALAELALGAPVAGVAATLLAQGQASLGDPTEGLDLTLEARRRDQPGQFDAKLQLQPKTEHLAVKLLFEEPSGGLVARLADLPGLPPVRLSVDGDGKLDDFAAKLDFVAGESIGAKGAATLKREGAGRRLSLDLDARVEGLLPPIAAGVFAGSTRLSGGVRFSDDGALGFEQLALQSQTARLDVAGAIDRARLADLKLTARALPTDGAGKTVAGRLAIQRFDLDATLKGPLAAPRVDAKLDIADAHLPEAGVGRATASVTLAPLPAPAGAETRFSLQADADVAGLKAADPAIAAAVGDRASLRLAARIDPGGVAEVSQFALDGAALAARFAGRVGAKELRGRLDLALPDLARLAGLAGVALKGRVEGGFDLSGAPAPGQMQAEGKLLATGLATGLAPLDAALGERVSLAGAILKPPLGFGFRDLRIEGRKLSARIDGLALPDRADIRLAGALADLAALDARLAGRADVSATLSGGLDKPDLEARLETKDARALDRPIHSLVVALKATDLVAAPAFTTTLAGSIAGEPARAHIAGARRGEIWRLDALDATIGSATLKGALALHGREAEGELSFAAADLDDLSALALTKLAGDIDAKIALTRGPGQSVALQGRGSQLRLGEARIDRFSADLRAGDVHGKPTLTGTLSVDRADIAGERIERVRFEAKPAAEGGAMTLAAQARGFDVDATGKLTTAAATRLDLSRLEARRGGKRIALAAPGAVTLDQGRVTLDRIALAIDRGRLELDGRLAPDLDILLRARALPLSAVDLVAPGTGLAGALDAEARLSGPAAAPRGDWRVTLAGLGAPPLRANAVQPLNVAASGRLADGRTSLEATIRNAQFGPVTVKGSAPLDPAGALDLSVAGRLDLGFLNARLAPDGRRVSGRADIAARLVGPARAPKVEGGATLAGVAFSDADSGLKLTDISGRIVGDATTLRLEGVTGRARNGGTIAASGRLSLDAGAGMPGEIRLTASGAELLARPEATAVADVALTVSGPLLRSPLIAGRIDFQRLDVTIPERLPANVRPIAKTKHVNAPPPVARHVAARKKAEAAARKGAGPDARLDLTIAAPNRVFVRGRGVDAELSGELRVRGAASDPAVVGGFQMRRGRLNVAGKRLDFARGNLVFSGSLQPELDFLAQTQAGDALVKVGLSGPAAQPDFAVSSEPDLPQDEIFARLLFGKSSGALAPAQLLQLALAAAQFAGGDGDDAFEKMRRQLGVDSLDVDLGGDAGVGVGVRKAINDRISIGAKAAARPKDSGVSVDVDLTRRLRLQGEATAGGGASVGIGFEMEY